MPRPSLRNLVVQVSADPIYHLEPSCRRLVRPRGLLGVGQSTTLIKGVAGSQWTHRSGRMDSHYPRSRASSIELRIVQFRLDADCAHGKSSTCTLSNGVAVRTRPVTTDRPKRSVRYSSPGSPMISRRSGSSHRFRSIHAQNASESRAPASSATSRNVPIRTRS